MRGPLLTLLLVAAYGALHSLLASRRAKDLARRAFGPAADRGYRLVYNIVATVTLLPVLAVPALDPGPVLYRIPWPWRGLTLAGQGLALLLLLLALRQTDTAAFLGLRQLADPEPPPSRLVVGGLYRWVRHPLYSAAMLFLWLTPVMTASLLALNLGLTVYFYIGSLFEERKLLAEFGPAYAEYRRQVPRFLPRPWRHAD